MDNDELHVSQCKTIAWYNLIACKTNSASQLAIMDTIGWNAMKSCTEIHCPQRMNPNDVEDLLTFHLASPWGWHFWILLCLYNFWMDWHSHHLQLNFVFSGNLMKQKSDTIVPQCNAQKSYSPFPVQMLQPEIQVDTGTWFHSQRFYFCAWQKQTSIQYIPSLKSARTPSLLHTLATTAINNNRTRIRLLQPLLLNLLLTHRHYLVAHSQTVVLLKIYCSL